MNSFLEAAVNEWGLNSDERAVLIAANTSSGEELLSLLWNFPNLAQKFQLDSAALSNRVAADAAGFLAVAGEAGLFDGEPPQFSFGAGHAIGAPWEVGSEVELPAPASMVADRPMLQGTAIDKRPGITWPVRDQERRGTCVAFAVTALREHLEFKSTGTIPDLSEQFLFWATKTRTADPRPNSDGTWIEFCRHALANEGVAAENLWPYVGLPIPGNVTQASGTSPSASAKADALLHVHVASSYRRGPIFGGNAITLLNTLRECRPVAISLPVMADPLRRSGNNWNSPVGVLYGKVLDPPPGSVVVGGHAVCVTGYLPDAEEPLGGHFIFRNSWGNAWGRNLPTAGYAAPEVGYGQVSATYVDRFLWELCRL